MKNYKSFTVTNYFTIFLQTVDGYLFISVHLSSSLSSFFHLPITTYHVSSS